MMHALAAAVLALMLVAAAPAAFAQERRIEPVDEAGKDASWTSFRRRLMEALEKRDRKYVLGIITQNVRNGSDAPRGIAEFRKQWELDADDSLFWKELRSALELGSAWLSRPKQRRELCAPYVLAKWPEDVDPVENGVLVAREVLVKSEPSSRSSTLATLSYQIVPVPDWEVDDRDLGMRQKWVKIRIKDKDGYVPEEQARSPIEHAACFVKGENGWRLTVFGPAGRD
ncbi:MAG TPA: hypothetical protein VJQ51_01165 [Burkholderiales bacterium]|nr:hypothetical protein [Burkholderiales bacterium]